MTIEARDRESGRTVADDSEPDADAPVDFDAARWSYRARARDDDRCRDSWPQDGWSFWCDLQRGHDGPHQEAGRGGDRQYVVLWSDPDG
jgi:hypothetical protein